MPFRISDIYALFFYAPLPAHKSPPLPKTEGTNIMREKSECFLCDLYVSTAGCGGVWIAATAVLPLWDPPPARPWQLNTFIKHVRRERERARTAGEQANRLPDTRWRHWRRRRELTSHQLTGWWTAQFKSHITHTFINKHTHRETHRHTEECYTRKVKMENRMKNYAKC